MPLFPLSHSVRLIIAVFDPENPPTSTFFTINSSVLIEWLYAKVVFPHNVDEVSLLIPNTSRRAIVGKTDSLADRALSLVCLPGIPGCTPHPELRPIEHADINDEQDFRSMVSELCESNPEASVISCSW